LELVAIDFEKAVTIRGPHPLVETPMVNPQELWPREELGRLLAGTPIPQEPLVAIASLPAATISRSVEAVAFHLGGAYTWAYSTIQVLRNRQGRMNVLAEEVWR
jgi:hypothetical protein